uniref:DNA-directed RNA polymerase subunit alpha n=1 Tax=uncultured Bacteroidota bacterium TaxID=152509 RepID=H5SNT5_9BACT|nr:DNA-directed RNA polymerase subunit alpha [uncultured Bacteroidetes bacterium]
MATLLSSPLILPETFEVVEETPSLGKYLIRPLEPGYGITIGNALRRVLLSSIEGYAIVTLKVPGVLHEFSTIPGVLEDVVDIVLNLKQVALRPRVEEAPSRIFVEVRGEEVFKAGDLEKYTDGYTVANPDLVIMHMDSSAVVQMELGVARGRGYSLADENKALLKSARTSQGSDNLHEIVLDTSFSPVIRVVPRVESILYRGRADYEQLLLEIETKGNIHPREALEEAVQILLQHFSLLPGSPHFRQAEGGAGGTLTPSLIKLLQTPIVDLELSLTATAYNSLRNAGVLRLIDLVQLSPKDLEKFRGIGRESVEKIENALKKFGLSLGMDVSHYKAHLS